MNNYVKIFKTKRKEYIVKTSFKKVWKKTLLLGWGYVLLSVCVVPEGLKRLTPRVLLLTHHIPNVVNKGINVDHSCTNSKLTIYTRFILGSHENPYSVYIQSTN